MLKVPIAPKLEYEKSHSSIGSTWATQTHNKFFFDFYSTPKRGMKQRLHHLARRFAK